MQRGVKMKIILLDGYTTTFDGIGYGRLSELGELTAYDYTPQDKAYERAIGADILITNKCIITDDIITDNPHLKGIALMSTGVNVVNTSLAAERNIPVCNIPAYSTNAVAQHTFALILALTNRAELHSGKVYAGEWSRCRDFTFFASKIIELAGKTLGIVGYGSIGRAVAKIAKAFGMNVVICSGHQITGERNLSMRELFALSDIVTLHCPLNPATEGMVNMSLLGLMKPDALLINTSRGPIINENDLADALNRGIIGGAAVDVLSKEPPTDGNPLLKARNCIITPHIAWGAKETRKRLISILCDNVEGIITGNIQNRVN